MMMNRKVSFPFGCIEAHTFTSVSASFLSCTATYCLAQHLKFGRMMVEKSVTISLTLLWHPLKETLKLAQSNITHFLPATVPRQR